jgi:S1-C subfamily serine protease
MTIMVPLPRAPKAERELAKYSDENFGLTFRSITYRDRLRKIANPGETGVVVLGVDDGSWAELAGFTTGDIIRSIGGVAVTDMESARARLKTLEKERSKRVVFFISRGVHTRFMEVQTDWSLPPVTAAKTSVSKIDTERGNQ